MLRQLSTCRITPSITMLREGTYGSMVKFEESRQITRTNGIAGELFMQVDPNALHIYDQCMSLRHNDKENCKITANARHHHALP